jgi:hydrogenase maturation protease
MNESARSSLVTLDDFNGSSSLIYGIGNVGRQDDGLGWALVDWLEAQAWCPAAEIRRHYQLQLEDADLISHKERVLFVDATRDESVKSFRVERAEPKLDFSFTSHAISISSIMATCRECFQRLPDVHVLALRGYEWELKMGLTRQAAQNLNEATAYLSKTRSVGFRESS